MKLNELKPSVPRKARKRIGRGESSGLGKTAGKGSNGQNSRAGGGVKPYFEGGQMPLYRRTPKRGFSNAIFRKDYAIINLCVIKKTLAGIKVLGNGELEKKVSVKAHKVSASAKAAIEAKGGSVEILEVKTFADVAKNNK